MRLNVTCSNRYSIASPATRSRFNNFHPISHPILLLLPQYSQVHMEFINLQILQPQQTISSSLVGPAPAASPSPACQIAFSCPATASHAFHKRNIVTLQSPRGGQSIHPVATLRCTAPLTRTSCLSRSVVSRGCLLMRAILDEAGLRLAGMV